jgi:hypothetical protein
MRIPKGHQKFNTSRVLVTLFLLINLFSAPPSASAQDEWVEVENAINGYLVSGGALHHSSYEKDRVEAATCEGCFWQIRRICESWEDEYRGGCIAMRLRCPSDMQVVEVFRANAIARPNLESSKWTRTGYSCVGEDGPASTEQIADRILASKFIELPELEFATKPPNRTLVNLPTRVVFNSPSRITDKKIKVAGIDVSFRASANRSVSCSSCLLIDNRTVFWQKSGPVEISSTARWRATFDAFGLSEIPVDRTPITQRKLSQLNVFQLQRKLTGDAQ